MDQREALHALRYDVSLLSFVGFNLNVTEKSRDIIDRNMIYSTFVPASGLALSPCTGIPLRQKLALRGTVMSALCASTAKLILGGLFGLV